MTVIGFEGAAGTGKTTSLMAELRNQLIANPLLTGQRVLGLTYMHGARRRLNDRLSRVDGLGGRYLCTTFDSYAWRLVNRWRSLAVTIGPMPHGEDDYETTCSAAEALLERHEVSEWVARSFPIMVIDEVQDCKRGRLGMIQGLAHSAVVLAAGDEFQDLADTGPNPALAWLEGKTKVVHLAINHRTDRPELLAAAFALRQGEPIHSQGNFRVTRAYRVDDAAANVARSLVWRWQGGSVVVLSPTRQSNAPFVRGTLERLGQGPIQTKHGQWVGPFTITWELDSEALLEELFECVGLVGDLDSPVDLESLRLSARFPGVPELGEWLRHQRRLGRLHLVTLGETQMQARRIIRRLRAYGSTGPGIKAMTIQQAKNREFDGVIVLWPYEVAGEADSLRRRLYNAVTRARKWVTVIVQDPAGVRLSQPPFA